MANIGPTLSKYTGAAELSALLESDKFGIYSAKSFLAMDGITDDYLALYNLINTTINGDKAEIWFKDGTALINSNITIPSNIKLVFLNGGMLKPGSGKTITGNNVKIEAGLHQIFDLSSDGILAGSFDVAETFVEWFGAIADNLTNNKSYFEYAIQFAITNDCKLKLQKGIYIVSSAISKSLSSIDLIIEGDSKNENLYSGTTILWKGGSGTLFTFTGARNVIFKNINIGGYDSSTDTNVFSAGSVGITCSGSVILDNCYLFGFEKLVNYNGGFYHKFINCHFRYFKYGFYDFNANNLIFDKCKAMDFEYFCIVNGGSGPVIAVNCSFERFVVTLFDADAGSYPSISFTNNYVENYPSITPPSGISGDYKSAIGIYSFSTVKCEGNTLFLTGIRRFIYTNNLTLNVTSKNNILLYAPTTSTTQYYIYDTNIDVLFTSDVAYDILTETTGAYTATYYNTISTKKPGSSNIYNAFTKTMLNKDSGTTANRPSANLYTGYIYFDTTLGKPIWWNGTAWIYADGTAV